jgi:hypothetical protein
VGAFDGRRRSPAPDAVAARDGRGGRRRRRTTKEEDDKGGGDGGEIMGGGTNKDRVWFLRTFVVFLCKKSDKLLASC